jgi:hypothetical protein
MNVRLVLAGTFSREWSILRENRPASTFIDPGWMQMDFADLEDAWDRVFDFYNVQRVIDEDLAERVGRERNVYERFHRNNLRFLSRLYAHNLYRFSGSGQKKLSEEMMRAALEELKLAWACPYYPCARS